MKERMWDEELPDMVNATNIRQGEEFIFNTSINGKLRKENPGRYIAQKDWKNRHSGPVIIAGAGPSLDDNLADIVEAHKAGIPIIATDRALPLLLRRGIRPLATVALEALFEHIVRFWDGVGTQDLQLVMCYRVDPQVATYWQGQVTLVNPEQTPARLASLTKKVQEEFDDEPITTGSNVGVFASFFARYAGFDDILLTGIDHCDYVEPDAVKTSYYRTEDVRGRECYIPYCWFYGQHEFHLHARNLRLEKNKRLKKEGRRRGRIINCSEGGILYGNDIERMSLPDYIADSHRVTPSGKEET